MHRLLGEALGGVDCLAELLPLPFVCFAVFDPGRSADLGLLLHRALLAGYLNFLRVRLLLILDVAGLLELLLAVLLLVRLVLGHIGRVAPASRMTQLFRELVHLLS